MEQHWRVTDRAHKVVIRFPADHITITGTGQLGFKRDGQQVAVFEAGSWGWATTIGTVERMPLPRHDGNEDTLRSMVRILRKTLGAVEWVVHKDFDDNSREFCPWCSHYKEIGHAVDCIRQLALDN